MTNSLSPQEISTLQSIFTRAQATGTQAPFLSMIMISPLMLLISNSLTAVKHSKFNLLGVRFLLSFFKKSFHDPCFNFQTQVFRCLGNDKPKLVVDMETLIWNTVKKISTCEMSAVDALEQLMKSLPISEISNMQDDDPVRTWFKPTITDPSITPGQTPWVVNGLSTKAFVNYEERVDNDGDTSIAVDSTQTIQNCQKKLENMCKG